MTITTTNGLKVRMASKDERAIIFADKTQSWYDNTMQYGRGHNVAFGSIGHSGTKTHLLSMTTCDINGSTVCVAIASYCGSQSYKSGLSVIEAQTLTCKKCGGGK